MRQMERPRSPIRSIRRMRAKITRSQSEDMYYRVYSHDSVNWDPTGPALTSLLPDGSHAPVLDVDGPIVDIAPTREGYAVTFEGRFNPRNMRENVSHLVRHQHLDRTTLKFLTQAERDAQARRLLGLPLRPHLTWVTLVFPYPVLAPGSKTPGHHHLMCQTSMAWERAKELAKYLSAAGLVDHRFCRISAEGDFMYVNRPLAGDDC